MINANVIYGSIGTDNVNISMPRTARLRGIPDEGIISMAESCMNELKKAIEYRYAYTVVQVKYTEDGYCDLGFGKIASRDLTRALGGCKRAVIMAVTAGHGVDRLLKRMAITSPARYCMADGAASEAIESFCNYTDAMIRGGGNKKKRFSPGYGDLSLEIQPQILRMLDAQSTLGITLNGALLMTPMKSITAIMGYEDE